MSANTRAAMGLEQGFSALLLAVEAMTDLAPVA